MKFLSGKLLTLLISATFLSGAEKNIIFFITDDESPTLGCYGDRVAKTPAIDALAKDGTLFLNAFATTASCSASRSVVMSLVIAQKLSMKALRTFMNRMASIGFGKFRKDMSMGGVAAPMAAPTTAAPTRSFNEGAGAGAGVRAHAGSFDGAGAGLAQSGSGLAAAGGAGGGAGGGCRAHSGSSAMVSGVGCLI